MRTRVLDDVIFNHEKLKSHHSTVSVTTLEMTFLPHFLCLLFFSFFVFRFLFLYVYIYLFLSLFLFLCLLFFSLSLSLSHQSDALSSQSDSFLIIFTFLDLLQLNLSFFPFPYYIRTGKKLQQLSSLMLVLQQKGKKTLPSPFYYTYLIQSQRLRRELEEEKY